MRITYLFLGLIFTNMAKAEKVSFILTNSSGADQVITVQYSDPSSGSATRQIWAGTIKNGQTISTDKKDITKNSTVYIYCSLKGARKKLNQYVITKKMLDEGFIITSDNITVEETALSNFTGTNKIIEFDSSFFLEKDIAPKSISGLFNQYLGGLIVYKEDTVDGKISKTLLDRVDPIELKTVMKNFPRASIKKSEKYFISSDNSVNVNGAFPGIVKASFNFSGQNLYELNVIYDDCGIIDWMKEGEINISDAFMNNVSRNTHYRLAKLREKYPNLRIRLIDKAYVLNSIFYDLKEHSISNADAELGISTFVTAKGNYNKEVLREDNLLIGSSYLGFWFSNSSPDVTANLELSKGAALSYALNVISALPTADLALQEYKKLRFDFPSLPELQSSTQIKNFLTLRVNEVSEKNEFKGNKSLSINIGDASLFTDNQIDNAYSEYSLSNPDLNLPQNIDDNTKKKIMSNLKGKE